MDKEVKNIMGIIANLIKLGRQPKLQDHSFFTIIQKYIQIEIQNLPITNVLKKRVVTEFMIIQFTAIEQLASSLIEEKTKFDKNKIEGRVLRTFTNIDNKALGKGVPSIFIEKYRGWNIRRIEMVIDVIRSIAESRFYMTDFDKLNAILDTLVLYVRLTIVDAESTIDELNGELERELKGTRFDY